MSPKTKGTDSRTSVLRTSRQQGRDPVDILVPLLVSATPAMADLAIPGRAPPDPARSRHA